MRKIVFLFLIFLSISVSSQSSNNSSSLKDIEPIENRSFDNNLKSKYNSFEFDYKEYEAPKKQKTKEFKNNKPADLSSLKSFVNFLTTIFPYLLALIVILIIVKSILNNDGSLWNFNRKKKIAKVAIVSENEDENIHLNDYLKLVEKAKKEGNFRKATRYYYLFLLKKMSDKELITFDKDKTNTEYLFDLKKTELRKNFSYLLYIYDYVWYGEFTIDHSKFTTIENKYQSFLNKL